MKRRLNKLVVFLLLGAIVNVAVAWGCVVVDLVADVDSASLSESERAWLRVTGDEPDPRREGQPVDASNGVGWDRRVLPLRDDHLAEIVAGAWVDGVDWPTYQYVKAGWPFRSLAGKTWLHGSQWIDPQTGISQSQRQDTAVLRLPRLRAPRYSQLDRLLPLQPIWPGFVANTIVCAVALWILSPYVLSLLTKTVAICRQQFHKPGHCINCGYDLRGTSGGTSGGESVCPECGATGP